MREAQLWKRKDTSKIKDFSSVEVISDWTFSSPYKASVRFLSKNAPKIKNATALELPVNENSDPNATIKVEVTDEEIPYARLGPENPI